MAKTALIKSIRIKSQNGVLETIGEEFVYMFKITEKKNNPIEEWIMHMNRQ